MTTIIPAVVGEPVELIYDSMIVTPERRRHCAVTGDLQPFEQLEDRARLVPLAPGDYQQVFACGPAAKSFIIRARAMPVSPPSKTVVFVGDSGTDHPGDGAFPGLVKARLPSVTPVGTRGTTTKHEGWAGKTNVWFASDPESPFTNGTTSLDIQHYFDVLGVVPDLHAESNGSNDIFSSVGNDAAVNAAITASFAARDQTRTAWRAVGGAAASTPFVYTTIWPGNYREAAWVANYEFSPRPTRDLYRRAHAMFCQRSFATYGDREGEGIYLLHTASRMSGIFHYPVDNAFHFTETEGHVVTAQTFVHGLVVWLLT